MVSLFQARLEIDAWVQTCLEMLGREAAVIARLVRALASSRLVRWLVAFLQLFAAAVVLALAEVLPRRRARRRRTRRPRGAGRGRSPRRAQRGRGRKAKPPASPKPVILNEAAPGHTPEPRSEESRPDPLCENLHAESARASATASKPADPVKRVCTTRTPTRAPRQVPGSRCQVLAARTREDLACVRLTDARRRVVVQQSPPVVHHLTLASLPKAGRRRSGKKEPPGPTANPNSQSLTPNTLHLAPGASHLTPGDESRTPNPARPERTRREPEASSPLTPNPEIRIPNCIHGRYVIDPRRILPLFAATEADYDAHLAVYDIGLHPVNARQEKLARATGIASWKWIASMRLYGDTEVVGVWECLDRLAEERRAGKKLTPERLMQFLRELGRVFERALGWDREIERLDHRLMQLLQQGVVEHGEADARIRGLRPSSTVQDPDAHSAERLATPGWSLKRPKPRLGAEPEEGSTQPAVGSPQSAISGSQFAVGSTQSAVGSMLPGAWMSASGVPATPAPSSAPCPLPAGEGGEGTEPGEGSVVIEERPKPAAARLAQTDQSGQADPSPQTGWRRPSRSALTMVPDEESAARQELDREKREFERHLYGAVRRARQVPSAAEGQVPSAAEGQVPIRPGQAPMTSGQVAIAIPGDYEDLVRRVEAAFGGEEATACDRDAALVREIADALWRRMTLYRRYAEKLERRLIVELVAAGADSARRPRQTGERPAASPDVAYDRQEASYAWEMAEEVGRAFGHLEGLAAIAASAIEKRLAAAFYALSVGRWGRTGECAPLAEDGLPDLGERLWAWQRTHPKPGQEYPHLDFSDTADQFLRAIDLLRDAGVEVGQTIPTGYEL